MSAPQFNKILKRLNKPELLKIAILQTELVEKIFIDIKQAQNDAFKASDADRHELLNEKLKQIIDPNRFSDIFADYKTDTVQTADIKPTTNKEHNHFVNQNTDDEREDVETASSYSGFTAMRPVAYKLPPNTPMFMADNMSCEDWFFIVENALKSSHIPIDFILPVMSPLFKGTALHLLKNYMRSGANSWYDFKEILRKTFVPKDYERQLREKLQKVSQNGDTIDNYNRRFLAISTQLPSLSDSDLIFQYTNGLSDQTKYEVLHNSPNSLDAAIELATQYEHCLRKTNHVEIKATTVKSGRYHSRHANSRQLSHKQMSSTSASQISARPRTQVTCYHCKRVGHYSTDCRQLRNQNSQRSTATESQVTRQKSMTNPVSNKQAQHKYRQALTLSRNSDDTLLRVYGVLAGIPDLFCTLDCAASVSMMSLQTAQQYNFEILPSDIKIKSANNAITDVVGITKPLLIDIHGHATTVSFVILHHDDHEILLGLDWFMQTGASVHPSSHTLRFPGTVVKLISSSVSEPPIYEQNEDNEFEDPVILSTTTADEEDIETEIDWYVDNNISMSPVANLSQEQLNEFDKLKQFAIESFATDYSSLGCCSVSRHEIRLETRIPIHCHPYRKSLTERKQLQDEIQKLLDAKIIRCSRSPYASPVILVPKKDGSVRMCVDYRRLNLQTIPEKWPLPRINDVLDGMVGSKWFTKLDLRSGYYQVAMSNNSIEKTAFVTPDGHYEFLRMPFGLRNAPSHFSKIMYKALGSLPFVKIYLDDITIHSETFEEHIQHVLETLKCLNEANLKLNGAKCSWFAQEISLLGHIINSNGIAMDPQKIETIQSMLPPQNVKQVQQFLGMVNYYRRFIKDFAKIAQPLANLIKKETPFNWTDLCHSAFEQLKKCLLTYPILRQPNFSREFLIYTDASGYALGAILSQKDAENNEYVCLYGSRLLKGAEIHYSITEKECLAVVWSIKQFRIYIHGKHFKVITDHNALVWLMSIKDPTAKLARWSIYLQSYDFEIIHRQGRVHSNVDTLSRPVLAAILANEKIEESELLTSDPLEDEALLHYLQFGRHLPGTSERKCKNVNSKVAHYKFENGKLWFRKNIKSDEFLEVPQRAQRYSMCSTEHLLGHFQADTVYKTLSTKYFWPKMRKDIEHIVSACSACLRHNKVSIQEHPAQAINPIGIFDRIGIDLVLGLPMTEEGYIGILVITEYLTKFPFAVPIKSKNSMEIAERLFEYISIFGPPKHILSDQGTEFQKHVDQLANVCGVEHQVTAAYNPRTNGLTERFNKTLCEALRKHAEADPTIWHKWLPYVLMAYRRRIHSITNYSPFQLLFGRSMNQFSNWRQDDASDAIVSLQQRSFEIQKLVNFFQPNALQNIVQHQPIQKEIQNQQHNIRNDSLEKGTTVYVKIEGLLGKLEPRYRGPYTVASQLRNGNYKLKNALGSVLKTAYPLHKLKLSPPEEGDKPHYEVEKIIKHRKSNIDKKFEYFVKWKNFDVNENSWVRESDFDTLEIVNAYWRSIHQCKKSKIVFPLLPLSPMILLPLTILIMMFGTIYATIPISEKITYCDNSNSPTMIDMERSCHHSRDNTWTNPPYFERNSKKSTFVPYVHVIVQKANKVHGTGWQCQMEKLFTRYYKTFLRDETIEGEWTETVHLSVPDCEMMVQFKRCHIYDMICSDNWSCSYEGQRIPKYEWLKPHLGEVYSCKIVRRVIAASDIDSMLFGVAGCTANKLSCVLKDSIIIWKSDIIDECPYDRVLTTNLTVDSDDILIDSTNKLLFKVISNDTVTCVTNFQGRMIVQVFPVFNTAEGMLLTMHPFFSTRELRNGTTLLAANEFILADKDYSDRILYKLFDHVSEELCLVFLNTIRIISRLVDEFVRIEDTDGNSIIVYANNGNVFLPTCVATDIIYVLDNATNCYEDLPVLFNYLNHNLSAFLTTDLILRSTSRMIDCKNIKRRYFYFPKSAILLSQSGTTVVQAKSTDLLWQAFDTSNKLVAASNKINHYHGVLDGLNNFDKQQEFVDVKEMGVSFTALDKPEDPVSIKSWWENKKWYFYGIGIIFFSLISLCGLSWLCTCANCCCLKFFCNPCVTCYNKAKIIRKKQQLATQLQALPLESVNPASRAIVMQLLTEPPRLSQQLQAPTIASVMSSVVDRKHSQVNDENEKISFQRQPSVRSSSSRKHYRNQSKRNRKHRDDVSLFGGVM